MQVLPRGDGWMGHCCWLAFHPLSWLLSLRFSRQPRAVAVGAYGCVRCAACNLLDVWWCHGLHCYYFGHGAFKHVFRQYASACGCLKSFGSVSVSTSSWKSITPICLPERNPSCRILIRDLFLHVNSSAYFDKSQSLIRLNFRVLNLHRSFSIVLII